MSLAERLLVLAGVALVGAGVAWVWRRGSSWVRRPLPDPGLPPGLYLFTSGTCSSCVPARSRIGRTGLDYIEVRFEDDPVIFDRLNVDKVPALVHAGTWRAWIAFGLTQPWLLRLWLRGEPTACAGDGRCAGCDRGDP